MTREFAAHGYMSPDGLRLHARIYDGAADRLPLLCMHGLTRNSADFGPLLDQLTDWPAISVDQRGRGCSAYDTDPTRYRPDIYCADMLALLEGLGQERVIAVGTSMGGLMSLMLAAMRPGMFAGIIINDIGPVVDPAGLTRLAGYVGQDMEFDDWASAEASIKAQGKEIFVGFEAQDWTDFARRVCEEDPSGRVRFAYDPAIADGLKGGDASAVPPDLWSLWDGIAHVPTLVLRGETSDILSVETAARMVAQHPRATLVTVPNRGHAPILDEAVALDAIRSFLGMLV
ncbi:MAG: alpha/beta fold hydrolase [Litorimonas sp.]